MADNRLYCSIILWNLSQSEQTVTSLRAYLRDYAVDAYSHLPGLRQKLWVSSTGPEGEIWGAVYLWDNEESAYGRPPAVSRVGELIGYRPTSREYFSVEAAVEGLSAVGALMAGLGMAYQDPAAEPLTRPREYVPGGDVPLIPTTESGPAHSPDARAQPHQPVDAESIVGDGQDRLSRTDSASVPLNVSQLRLTR